MNKERIFENVLRETRQYVCLDKFPLLEDNVNRLINKHAQNGFAIISAFRDSLNKKENLERTERLKNLLTKMGWSYTICYGGGFIEKEVIEDGDVEFDTSKHKFNEISFIVYNYNRLDKNRDLLQGAIKLCGMFDQDDIYFQEPNGKAYWYDRNGNRDATFSLMTKNDDGQMFFTGFGSSKLSKKLKDIYLKKGKVQNAKAFEHRFSGIMEAVAMPPQTNIEEEKRRRLGEVFISKFNVLSDYEAYKILNS